MREQLFKANDMLFGFVSAIFENDIKDGNLLAELRAERSISLVANMHGNSLT